MAHGRGRPPKAPAPASLACADMNLPPLSPLTALPCPDPQVRSGKWFVMSWMPVVSPLLADLVCAGCAPVTAGRPPHGAGRWVLLPSLCGGSQLRPRGERQAPRSVVGRGRAGAGSALPSPVKPQRLGDRALAMDCVSCLRSHRAQRQPGIWAEPGGLSKNEHRSPWQSPGGW